MGDLNNANQVLADVSNIADFTVDPMQTDTSQGSRMQRWSNPNGSKWLGNYKKIPELKKSIDALATWTVGKGYTTDLHTQLVLEHISGWGEDTFDSIMRSMIISKKIYGDAYAEIIRDPDTGILLNLKQLDSAKMQHECDENGLIVKYIYGVGKETKEFKKSANKILHLCNNRIGDEIHGTSVVEACEWIIDARNEAMRDFRKILHRNMHFRYMEVDFSDKTTMNTTKENYKEAIERGDIMLIPKGAAEIKTSVPSIIDPMTWIRYLENFFYNAVGVPKVVLGGSEEFTESSAKVGYLTFEQVYSEEQRDLEADLWNQVYIKIKFNKPASLKNEMLSSEEKTPLTQSQPHDLAVSMTQGS